MAIELREIVPARLESLGEWLAGQLSRNTSRAYQGDIRMFLEWAATRDLDRITREDVYRYRAWLLKRYRPATVNRRLSSVRQLFAEAMRHRMLDHNPVEGIKGCKLDPTASTTKAPSLEQVRLMIELIEGNGFRAVRDRALIYLLAGMGLRCEEAVSLRVEHFGQDQGFCVVDVTGKGNKTRRLPVPEPVLLAVRPLAKRVIEGFLFRADPRIDQPIITRTAYNVVVKRMGAAGIEQCSPHSLRHFMATDAFRQGADLYRVQRALGHADPRTTQRYDRSRDDLDNSISGLVRI